MDVKIHFSQRVLMAAAATLVILVLSLEESPEQMPGSLFRTQVQVESQVSIVE
ncbi:MAG: hypothetical protein AAFO04_13940 [Cyanobacteria bacterium J06592_8]